MQPRPPLVAALTPELRATARDFERARTPPGRIFFDDDAYRHDLRSIFGSMWVCAGHASRVAAPGSFFRIDVGDESLLIVRDQEGRLGAFFNVCRHRGTRLTSARAGECRGFTCPYHAWHYGLDGALKSAPTMDAVADFRREEYPLVRARVDEFMGFLFVHLGADPAPLADQFDDFPDFGRYALGELECVARHDYEIDTNWKLICQNFHECYHCAVAHPDLHRVSRHETDADVDASGRLFIGGPMALREGYTTLTKSGRSDRSPLPGASADDRRRIHYFHLLPNLLLSIAPDYVLTHHVWPRGPERVFVETAWLFAPEQIAAAGFDASDAIDFWDTTNRQDWALCENALLGLKSAQHRPGPYHPSEQCAHRFDSWYVRTLLEANA